MYYLQTRYYNPGKVRFLNADIYVSTGHGLLDSNMFAYCWNNPVIRRDEAGTDPLTQATADDTNPLDDYENFGRLPGGGGGVRGSVRNPWGRPGGTKHQGVVDEVKEWYEARGIATTTTEPYIRIEGGLKGGRYGDVGVYGGNNGQLRSIVQVGKVNANGTPISREMKAIYDLNLAGYTVIFVPYNASFINHFIFVP